MILTTFFTHVNDAFRGSDDDAPTSGTDFNLWLRTTNRKIAEWARDGKQTRSSLFSTKVLGTVAAGTQSYNLTNELITASDDVNVVTSAYGTIDITLVEPQERDQYTNAAYLSGLNPQTLTFIDTIGTGSKLVGGSIQLSGFWLPSDLTAGTDTIPVDDPFWLVYAVASELAFNDLTYESKYGDLITKANNLYQQMGSNNRRGTSKNPRRANYSTSASRIIDTSTESGVSN